MHSTGAYALNPPTAASSCANPNIANGNKGAYPLLFRSNGGIGQTRRREEPARAPDCHKFSSDALVRCPQTLASTHIRLFFSENVVGVNGTAVHEGCQGSPLLTTCWGGVYPRKSTECIHCPRVTAPSSHLTEIIPLHDHLCQPQKQVQRHLLVTVYNRPDCPRAEQPANKRQLRVVAIDFFGK